MWNDILKTALCSFVTTVLGLFLFIITAAGLTVGFLSFNRYDLTPFLTTIINKAGFSEKYLSISQAWLFFDGGFKVEMAGVVYAPPNSQQKILLENVQLEFSNHMLALGQLSLKHLNVSGVDVSVALYEDKVEVAGTSFPLSSQSSGLDAWDMFDGLADVSPLLAALKTARFDTIFLQLFDGRKNVNWQVVVNKGYFTSTAQTGDHLEVRATISQPDSALTAVPVKIELDHAPKAPEATLTAVLKHTNVDLIAEYLPEGFKDVIKGQGEVAVGTTLSQQGLLGNPFVEIAFVDGALFVPYAHRTALPFKTLQGKGYYSAEDDDKLVINQLELVDTNGITFRVSGELSKLKTAQVADMRLTASDGSFEHILPYLPDAVIPETIDWLKTHMSGAQIHNFEVLLRGALGTIPHCGKACGITGRFAFENLRLKFLDQVSAAENLNGSFFMHGDSITIKTDKPATLAAQQVQNLEVKIAPLFTDGTPPSITISGMAQGPVDGVLRELEGALSINEGMPENVEGTHTSDILLAFPLGEADLKLEHFTLKVDSVLNDIKVAIKQLENRVFEANLANLLVTDKSLTLAAEGVFDGMPATATWKEDMQQFGDATQVQAEVALPVDRIFSAIELLKPTGSGIAQTNLTLERNPETSLFAFDVAANLREAELNFGLLNAAKEMGTPARLTAEGQFDATLDMLNIQGLQLVGNELEVVGRFQRTLQPNRAPRIQARFSPFKVGRTNANVTIENEKITLQGAALDITGVVKNMNLNGTDDNTTSRNAAPQTQQAENAQPNEDDLFIRLNIGQVWSKDNTIKNLEGFLQRQNGVWVAADLEANINTNDKAIFNIARVEKSNNYRLNATATDAGKLLQTLDIYQNVRGGRLRLDGTFRLDGPNQNAKGEGELWLADIRVVKAPILARLLGLLSLQELFSPQAGISFDNSKFAFNFKSGVINLEEGAMNGPALGLRFNGSLNLENDRMDLSGQLIPVSGVNKLIDSLPVIGTLLTGSQEGLVVADFTVKGPFDDPSVFVNPLSVVTPGLLKDFFGIFNN